jgi:hypothetical protein
VPKNIAADADGPQIQGHDQVLKRPTFGQISTDNDNAPGSGVGC